MLKFVQQITNNRYGVLISVLLGLGAYYLSQYLKTGLADPLLIAMLFGIMLNKFLPKEKLFDSDFRFIPFMFIPIGVIFYAFKNLNFVKIEDVNPYILLLLVVIILVHYFVAIVLGRILKQKEEITYLTATGGAICGASAITITAPAVKAEADDVSISLLSVAIAAVFGLFVLLPFLAVVLQMNNEIYAIFSGSVLQFTGFVKASISTMPPLNEAIANDKTMGLATSVKAVRYLGLLIAIPLFASLVKKKFTLPWYLWAFLGAGIFGSLLSAKYPSFYSDSIILYVKLVYNILWSVAMAAIGLNTNVGKLLSNFGLKAMIMAFVSFFVSIAIFLLGIHFIY